MLNDILFALWFFLPAGVANVTPILAIKAPLLKKWNTPIDLNKSWRGRRLLGNHKTWRGIVTGAIAAILVVWLQVWLFQNYEWARDVSAELNYRDIPVLGLGLALGIGALGGDALKSFFKRRMEVNDGHTWFPFDQLDYVVGGLLLSSLVVDLTFSHYAWVIAVWFGMHLLFSYIGFLLKLKESPI